MHCLLVFSLSSKPLVHIILFETFQIKKLWSFSWKFQIVDEGSTPTGGQDGGTVSLFWATDKKCSVLAPYKYLNESINNKYKPYWTYYIYFTYSERKSPQSKYMVAVNHLWDAMRCIKYTELQVVEIVQFDILTGNRRVKRKVLTRNPLP